MPDKTLLCPSSSWNAEGAVVFGVVGGEVKAPRVMFMKQVITPNKELEQKLGGIAPEEVFRVASPCNSKCGHHNGQGCNLVGKIVEHVAPVYDDYATCAIRATCVWWSQEGMKACLRCPEVVRNNSLQTEQISRAASQSADTAKKPAEIA